MVIVDVPLINGMQLINFKVVILRVRGVHYWTLPFNLSILLFNDISAGYSMASPITEKVTPKKTGKQKLHHHHGTVDSSLTVRRVVEKTVVYSV